MPTINGVNVDWNEGQPAGNESIGLGDDRIRAFKTSVRSALAAEHNFDSGGGVNTGYHVLGSARPFYGTQSLVSSSGSDGRLMIASDSSRLFAVNSNGTMFIGGDRSLSVGTYPGGTAFAGGRHYWALEVGEGKIVSTNTVVTFPNSGFSGAPFIMLTALSATAMMNPTEVGRVSFTANALDADGNTLSNLSFTWLSIGTRVF